MRTLCAALLVVLAGCASTPAARPPVPPPTEAAPPPPAAPSATPATPAGPPIARTVGVVDHEFGIEVRDPYRWMEGDDNAELKAWLLGQAKFAASELAKLHGRDKLYTRIRTLGLGLSEVYDVDLANGRMFYEALAAGDQLAKLMVREPDGKSRILIDPQALGTAEAHVALHAWSPSHDGKLIAYVLSSGGGEVGVMHMMDVATGKDLPDQIERIWGEGSASWLPDSKSFFYTQLAVPRPGVDPMLGMTVRFHKLGEPADKDVTILGRDAGSSLPLATEEWPSLWVQPGTTWVTAWVGGAHSESRLAIAKLAELDWKGTGKTPWKIVADYPDAVESGMIHGDRLYLRTYKDAPNRRIISVPLAHPELAKARVEIPEDPNAALSSVRIARDGLYLLHMVNGRARLSRWAWNAKVATPIPLPVDGWASDLATDSTRDGIVLQLETWVAPGAYYAYDATTQKVAPIGLASSATEVSAQLVAEEVEATSADGTKVPLSILHLKDLALDGSHPTILYAYGGYGSSETPGFGPTRLAWIERGGVFAIAHVRGGGEKGRRWQDDGSREKKMNGIRDFIACGEYLVERRYTSPGKLAGVASSMGGVLIGRAITVRPDLFAAVNIDVGIVNPLRILFAENGANQKTELGDPETEAGYRSILEMDPYQHVQPNTPYPAVIFTAGLNDHRVAPWMTGKMAARLLASTTSGKPVLVRIDSDAGHGIGSTRDQAYAERADVWSFYLSAFGDPEFTAK
jgi:prolyl oligopeptidase